MATPSSSVFVALAVLLLLCGCATTSTALHVAPVTTPPLPKAPVPTSLELGAAEHMSCDSCTKIVSTVIALNATQRTGVDAIIAALCKAELPHANETKLAALCAAIGKDVIAAVPWINKELSSLAWDVPLGFCSVFVPVCHSPCCEADAPPDEVHLSLTHNDTEMAVTWVTLDDTTTSTVQWGEASAGFAADALPNSANGAMYQRTFKQGGWLGTIHSAVMTGLKAGTAYSYRVGDASQGWSPVFQFSTLPANAGTTERPLRIAQIGDTGFGDESNQTIATLTKLVDAGKIDVMLHVGDIGYADGFMTHWDVFLRKVQPIASRVPYMTAPGNHELWYDFMAYKERFFMPLDDPSMPRPPAPETKKYYSFDMGPVHMVMYNTETWFDTPDISNDQVAWIKADLEAANAKRSDTPWILTAGHRPLYCSNHGIQCGDFANWLRTLIEDTFSSNKVDMVIQCHEHSMERSYPLYKGVVQAKNYTDPTAPVYIVNGAGGNREGNTNPNPEPWVVYHSSEIGFGLITVSGPSKLQWQFMHASGSVLDEFEITKA